VAIKAPAIKPIKGGMYTLFFSVSLFGFVKAYIVNASMAVPKSSTKNAAPAVTGSLEIDSVGMTTFSIKCKIRRGLIGLTYKKYSPKALADAMLPAVPRIMLCVASN
jgi:hypothetical protein